MKSNLVVRGFASLVLALLLGAGCVANNGEGPALPLAVEADQANGFPGGMSTTDSQSLLIEAPAEGDVLGDSTKDVRSNWVAATRILSQVRFAPQVPPGSWSLTMSCGPASLNLACAYLWGAVPDQYTYIRRINSYLGKQDINNCLPGGTSTSDLERAGRAVNNCTRTYRASGWTLARIRQEIDAGRPVVVAVRAGSLPNRGYSYTGGHFVLVVGYDGTNMICHDPGTSSGAFKTYSNTNFASAMATYGGAVVVAMR